MDSLGGMSLAILRLDVIQASFAREVLIVDDTWLRPDRFIGGVLRQPIGSWPMAAELDTFLFARGGVPWRGYPPRALSSPGAFAGYDLHTLGTRPLLRHDLT